jgi:hypothetical protein
MLRRRDRIFSSSCLLSWRTEEAQRALPGGNARVVDVLLVVEGHGAGLLLAGQVGVGGILLEDKGREGCAQLGRNGRDVGLLFPGTARGGAVLLHDVVVDDVLPDGHVLLLEADCDGHVLLLGDERGAHFLLVQSNCDGSALYLVDDNERAVYFLGDERDCSVQL